MKRIILITFVFVSFLANGLSAQFFNDYGIKVGMTNANQDWTYATHLGLNMDANSRWGTNFGVFAETISLLNLSIVPEVNYIQKGMKSEVLVTGESGPGIIGNKTFDNRVDYLNICLLGKFGFNLLLANSYILAGPKMDLQINDSVDEAFKTVFDDFKKNILGFTVGLGAEVNVLLLNVLAEIRYNYDITEVYHTDLLDIKNRSFDIRAGIKF